MKWEVGFGSTRKTNLLRATYPFIKSSVLAEMVSLQTYLHQKMYPFQASTIKIVPFDIPGFTIVP